MLVYADKIDKASFSYICPYCQERHHHGSNGDFRTRVEYRIAHCHKSTGATLEILIDANTKKIETLFS